MTYRNNIKVLIPAAGKGSRSNLSYPKTLFEVNKKPILLRIFKKINTFDISPTVIVSQSGKNLVRKCLIKNKYKFEIIEQRKPKGMGDAILKVKKSKFYKNFEHVLLIWGDLPYLSSRTLGILVKTHLKYDYDFTFPTLNEKNPYTYLRKDKNGKVLELLETRQMNKIAPIYGERDIGVFIFKKKIINMLSKNFPEKISPITKEHGFLYILKYLIKNNYKIKNLLIAKSRESISLNKISDLNKK